MSLPDPVDLISMQSKRIVSSIRSPSKVSARTPAAVLANFVEAMRKAQADPSSNQQSGSDSSDVQEQATAKL